MEELNNRIKRLKKELNETKHILISADDYLSEKAGLDIYGKMFTDNFQDFIEKYGFTNMYNGTFYPYKQEEERWAYLARYFYVYLNQDATELYKKLFEIVKEKDYFVITKTFDEQFYKSGFKKSRVYASNGDCRHLQCKEQCHNQLYDFVELTDRMVKQTDERMIPRQLVPECPECGGLMDLHLVNTLKFIKDPHYLKQHEKYGRFTSRNKDEKTLVLQFDDSKTFDKIVKENLKWTLVKFKKEKGAIGKVSSSLFKPFKNNKPKENVIIFEEEIEDVLNKL